MKEMLVRSLNNLLLARGNKGGIVTHKREWVKGNWKLLASHPLAQFRLQ